MNERRIDARVGLALATVYFVWGSTYLAMRYALEGFPPLMMAGLRYLLAGGLLFAGLRLRGVAAPSGRQWWNAALIGLLLLGVGNCGVAFAEQWVASSLAAVLIASVPLWSALFSGLWGAWPRRVEALGLLVGGLGVLVLNLGGDLRATPLGAGVLLLAAAGWAFGSVWSRRLDLPAGPMASAAQMLAAGAVLLGLGLATGGAGQVHLAARPVLAVGYLVVFGSVVAFSAYGYLLRAVSPALATSYAFVNPVVAVALGVGLGGERLGAGSVVGAGVVLAGVVLVAWGRARG